jgi:predicted MPP superfamily phosphohydrolase
MDTHKYLPLIIAVTVLFYLFDLYFLKSWTKFIKEHKWNKLFYQIMWGIGIFVFIISFYSLIMRIIDRMPHQIERYLYLTTAIWYLPKIVITPVLIIKDLIKFIIQKFKSFSFKRQTFIDEDKGNQKSYDNSDEQDFSYSLEKKNGLSRRKLLKMAGWSIAGVPYVMVANGMINTTYDFQIHKSEIPLFNLPKALDGLRLVQLSDIHAGSFNSQKPMERVAFLVNTLNPDLILITGDFVNFEPDEIPFIYNSLKALKAKYGVFGCLGNHDHYMSLEKQSQLIEILRSAGINLLINSNIKIDIEKEQLQIAGMDNSSERIRFGDLGKALDGLNNDEPIILLSHDPINWDREVRALTKVDLMLSGHTHGGQIGIEIFGQTITPSRIVYKQYAGLYRYRDQYLYVNRGIGTVGPPVRVGIPPEISLHILRKASNLA